MPPVATPAAAAAELGVAPLPEALESRPDLAAAWPFMCPPVRERYAADASRDGLARRVMRGMLGRVAARRQHSGIVPSTLNPRARILVVQPDHHGGVIASSPAIRLLKETLPESRVSVLAGPWGADAAEHCPAVDRVLRCRFPSFERRPVPATALFRLSAKARPYVRLWREANALTREQFDVAVLLLPDAWAAALVSLAAIPLRFGFETPECRAFLTHGVSIDARPVGKLMSGRPTEAGTAAQLRLAAEVLRFAGREPLAAFDSRTVYEPTAEERAEATRFWGVLGLEEGTQVVAVHPAPGGAAKRWSAASFAALVDHLYQAYGAHVVLTGAPGDRAECEAVAAASRSAPRVIAGQTTFGVLAALLDRCRLVVGTDNGALHLATARGVPTLRLFGPTDPGAWAGWTGGHPLPTISLASPRPCAPCHRLDVPDWRTVPGVGGDVYPCMVQISVEAAIETLDALWQETAA